MMPLRNLSKNKLLLQKHWNVNEFVIDSWPFWELEERLSIIEEVIKEEENERGKQEENSDFKMPQMPSGFDMGSISNMMNGFKK